MIKRREFIAGLGSAAAWPLAPGAQQGARMRRIGVLMVFEENDPAGEARFSGFAQGLSELGWTDGRNLRMDVRWAGDNVDRMWTFAKELVDLQPDVLLSIGTPATAALQRATRTIPIVFVAVGDPIGAGFVAGLHQPGRDSGGQVAAVAHGDRA
jgi:putative tryptophan/tyrosine transport system substrate-binding protein